MANIPLQSITFPDLLNIYNVPTMEGIGKSIFPELIAGGLVDLDSYVENSNPYLFAAMPQGAGKVLNDELVGAKVANNQLASALDATHWSSAVSGTTNVQFSDGVASFLGTVQYAGLSLSSDYRPPALKDHKYFFTVTAKAESNANLQARSFGGYGDINFGVTTEWTTKTSIFNLPEGDLTLGNRAILLRDRRTSGWDTVSFKNVMLIDLTQMLGSTVADYIHSLEQATAGAGVAFFTNYFGSGYRPYDAGSLQGALVSGHKTIGVNQWDEEWEQGGINSSSGANATDSNRIRSKNYIPIAIGSTYYIKAPQSLTGFYYDKNKEFIGYAPIGYDTTLAPVSNARYLRFTIGSSSAPVRTYANNICINISNADINGKYFPYEEHTYDIEPEDLNGIFVLDNGELKADGDVRKADGTVDRRFNKGKAFGLIDCSWNYMSDYNYWFVDSSNYADVRNTIKMTSDNYGIVNILPIGYKVVSQDTFNQNRGVSGFDKVIAISSTGVVYIKDTSCTSTSYNGIKSIANNIDMVYEKPTPTEDTAEPFEEYQHCNPYGTQEYLLDDSQTVPIPAGHNTKYFEDPLANIMARLDALENA